MDIAEQYPFLEVALEDYAFLERLRRERLGTARHGVLLMYDVLEFTFYEVLALQGKDIYRTGQNTIGFDAALKEYRSCGFSVPLIGSVRRIQKLRGDAKHHAQSPSDDDYARLVMRFGVIVSRIIHEHFGLSLGSDIESLGLVPYHTALFESYRRYRSHNWDLALRLGVSAVLHKHRRLLGYEDDYRSMFNPDPLATIGVFEREISGTAYEAVSEQVLEFLDGLPGALRELLATGDIQAAAERVGTAYSRIDEMTPAIFDISAARKLTSHLYQPDGFDFEGSMSWSWWHRGDTSGKAEYEEQFEHLLRANPALVESFGAPYDESDEDRRWSWWEFAIFDGVRWHSFMLTSAFHLDLESGGIEDDVSLQRESLARLILEEFSKCVPAVAEGGDRSPT